MHHAILYVNNPFDLRARPLVSTYRERAMFADRIEREYKSEIGAKALGIYRSLWRHASNTDLDCHVGISRIAKDNGIRSRVCARTHRQRLIDANLISVERRFTATGIEVEPCTTLLDPWAERPSYSLIDTGVFRVQGGQKLTPNFDQFSPSLWEGEKTDFQLSKKESECANAESAHQSTPPQLSQAAEAGCTVGSTAVLVMDEQDQAKHVPSETPQETLITMEDNPVSHEEDKAEPYTFATPTATDVHRAAKIAEMREKTGMGSPETYFASLSEYEQEWIEGEMRARIEKRDGKFAAEIAFSAIIMGELWGWMKEKGLTTVSCVHTD